MTDLASGLTEWVPVSDATAGVDTLEDAEGREKNCLRNNLDADEEEETCRKFL